MMLLLADGVAAVGSPLHFTGEVSLGSIAIVVTLIGIAISMGRRVGIMETTLVTHAATMTRHTARMDKYEERLIEMSGNMQRFIGRIEATQDRIERKTGYRAGEGDKE